jgi:hypothetical protein
MGTRMEHSQMATRAVKTVDLINRDNQSRPTTYATLSYALYFLHRGWDT